MNDWKVGDVVQIDPNTQRDGFFPGCFMVITEVKPWGAQGYISVPGARGEPPGRAYFRAKHEDMELVGRAVWISGDDA